MRESTARLLIQALKQGIDPLAVGVLRRVFAEEKDGKKKPKRMVIMVGPPAAGKGFFVGDPGPEGSFGWKFPDSTHGLFKKDDIPEQTEYDESDNHLKMIQRDWAQNNHKTLSEAHKKGKAAFDDALKGMWYDTKDGKRVNLGDVLGGYDKFDEDFDKFYGKANKDFYVSMRGWHDDAKQKNPETGKSKERFKDEARHLFDDSINEKIDGTDKDMLIVDSAGEDIDAQDFKAQIERAKANGYEATVIFLHPEKADTELSNLARGRVQGKRMVDQADIDNWYKKNEQALKDIQSADPDNFLHYRKPPPDPDPGKAAEMRQRARELMEKLPSPPVQEKGESKETFSERQKKWKTDNKSALDEVTKTLYMAAPYPKDPDKRTSWGRTLDPERVPQKPPKDLAKTVANMNDEADARDKAHRPKEEKKEDAGKKEEDSGGGEKGKGEEPSATRMDFLHDMGDKKVPNPNPKSKDRYPEVQIRSLDWEYQKQYYEKWKKSKQASMRVISRYLAPFRIAQRFKETVMAAEESHYQSRINSIAKEVKEGLKGGHYEAELKEMKGPTFFIAFKGGQGDMTEAKKLKPKMEKLVEEGIKKHIGESGFKCRVLFTNKGEDLLAEVDILFP